MNWTCFFVGWIVGVLTLPGLFVLLVCATETDAEIEEWDKMDLKRRNLK